MYLSVGWGHHEKTEKMRHIISVCLKWVRRLRYVEMLVAVCFLLCYCLCFTCFNFWIFWVRELPCSFCVLHVLPFHFLGMGIAMLKVTYGVSYEFSQSKIDYAVVFF